MSLIFQYPTTSPTITLTVRSAFIALVNVQTTLVQTVHIAQGGKAFVFSPSLPPVQNTVLPLEIRWLHEANDGSFTGWAALRSFILTTLQGAANPVRITDPDGTTYTTRYMRGLETMQEVQQGRFTGVLVFRVEV